jgi:hypothetical protein
MSEIEILSQANDEADIACNAAREEYVVLDRAEHLIVELAGGIVKLVNTFTADQYAAYEAFDARVSAALTRYVETNVARHAAFVAYYKARFGVDLDASKAEEPAAES